MKIYTLFLSILLADNLPLWAQTDEVQETKHIAAAPAPISAPEDTCSALPAELLPSLDEIILKESPSAIENRRHLYCNLYQILEGPPSLSAITTYIHGRESQLEALNVRAYKNMIKTTSKGERLTQTQLNKLVDMYDNGGSFNFLVVQLNPHNVLKLEQYFSVMPPLGRKYLDIDDALRYTLAPLMRLNNTIFFDLLLSHQHDPINYIEVFERSINQNGLPKNKDETISLQEFYNRISQRFFEIAPSIVAKDLYDMGDVLIDPSVPTTEILSNLQILEKHSLMEICSKQNLVWKLCMQFAQKGDISPKEKLFLQTFYSSPSRFFLYEKNVQELYSEVAPLMDEISDEAQLKKMMEFFNFYFIGNNSINPPDDLFTGPLSLGKVNAFLLHETFPHIPLNSFMVPELAHLPLEQVQTFTQSIGNRAPSFKDNFQLEDVVDILPLNLGGIASHIRDYTPAERKRLQHIVQSQDGGVEYGRGCLQNTISSWAMRKFPVESFEKLCELLKPYNGGRSEFLVRLATLAEKSLYARRENIESIQYDKFFTEDLDKNLPFLRYLMNHLSEFQGSDILSSADPIAFLKKLQNLKEKEPKLTIHEAISLTKWNLFEEITSPKNKGISLEDMARMQLGQIRKGHRAGEFPLTPATLLDAGARFIQAHGDFGELTDKLGRGYAPNPLVVLGGIPQFFAQVDPQQFTQDLDFHPRQRWKMAYKEITSPVTPAKVEAAIQARQTMYQDCRQSLWPTPEGAEPQELTLTLLSDTLKQLPTLPGNEKRKKYLSNCLFTYLPKFLSYAEGEELGNTIHHYYQQSVPEIMQILKEQGLTEERHQSWWQDRLSEYQTDGKNKWTRWNDMEKLGDQQELVIMEVPPLMSLFKGAFSQDCSMNSTSFYGLLKDVKTYWLKNGDQIIGSTQIIPMTITDPESGLPITCPTLLSLGFNKGESKLKVQVVMQALEKIYGQGKICLPNLDGDAKYFYNSSIMSELYEGLPAVAATPPESFSPEMARIQSEFNKSRFLSYYVPQNLQKVHIYPLTTTQVPSDPGATPSASNALFRMQAMDTLTPLQLYGQQPSILEMGEDKWRHFLEFLTKEKDSMPIGGTEGTYQHTLEERAAITTYSQQLQAIRTIDQILLNDKLPKKQRNDAVYKAAQTLLDDARMYDPHTRIGKLSIGPANLVEFNYNFFDLIKVLMQKHGKGKLLPLLQVAEVMIESNLERLWKKYFEAPTNKIFAAPTMRSMNIQEEEEIAHFFKYLSDLLPPKEQSDKINYWLEKIQQLKAPLPAHESAATPVLGEAATVGDMEEKSSGKAETQHFSRLPVFFHAIEKQLQTRALSLGVPQCAEESKGQVNTIYGKHPNMDFFKDPRFPVRNQGGTLLCTVEATLANIDHVFRKQQTAVGSILEGKAESKAEDSDHERPWFRSSSLMALLDFHSSSLKKATSTVSDTPPSDTLSNEDFFKMDSDLCLFVQVLQENGICSSEALDDQFLEFYKSSNIKDNKNPSHYLGDRQYISFLRNLFTKYKAQTLQGEGDAPDPAPHHDRAVLSDLVSSGYFNHHICSEKIASYQMGELAVDNLFPGATAILEALQKGDFLQFAKKVTEEFCPASERRPFPYPIKCKGTSIEKNGEVNISREQFQRMIDENIASHTPSSLTKGVPQRSLLDLSFCGQAILQGKGYRAKLKDHSYDVSKDTARCGNHHVLLLGVRVNKKCQRQLIIQNSWGRNCSLVSPDWECDPDTGITVMDEEDVYENMIRINELSKTKK